MSEEEATPYTPRSWWLVELQGLAAAVYAAVVLIWPGTGQEPMILLTGLLIAGLGVGDMLDSLAKRSRDHGWRIHFITGLFSSGIGTAILAWDALSIPLFMTLAGVWAIGAGILQMVQGTRADLPGDPPEAYGLAGAASFAVGLRILLASHPPSETLLLELLGINAAVTGFAWILRARSVRAWALSLS